MKPASHPLSTQDEVLKQDLYNMESKNKKQIVSELSRRRSSTARISRKCIIHPSRLAHNDDLGNPDATLSQDELLLESTRGSSFGKEEKHRYQKHTLRYKGDVVWTLETSSVRSRVGGTTWGTTSSCHLSECELYVHMVDKGKLSSPRNKSQQFLVFNVHDILRESSNAWLHIEQRQKKVV